MSDFLIIFLIFYSGISFFTTIFYFSEVKQSKKYSKWSFKQKIFVNIISGPYVWIINLTILLIKFIFKPFFSWFWELLADKPPVPKVIGYSCPNRPDLVVMTAMMAVGLIPIDEIDRFIYEHLDNGTKRKITI